MTIVLDASALVELLLGTGRASDVRGLLADDPDVHAPELLGIETLSALRRLSLRGSLDRDRAEAAVEHLRAFPLTVHGHLPLHPRVWDLRGSMSAYDATYVALAEALDAALLTRDERLACAAADLVPLALDI